MEWLAGKSLFIVWRQLILPAVSSNCRPSIYEGYLSMKPGDVGHVASKRVLKFSPPYKLLPVS
jgi:hypothetical protein